jgi:hypothetical protein
MAGRTLHCFNGAVTNKPALAKRKKNFDVQQPDTPVLTPMVLNKACALMSQTADAKN